MEPHDLQDRVTTLEANVDAVRRQSTTNATEIQSLNNAIYKGNGKESVMIQLEQIRTSGDQTQESIKSLERDVRHLSGAIGEFQANEIKRRAWFAGATITIATLGGVSADVLGKLFSAA